MSDKAMTDANAGKPVDNTEGEAELKVYFFACLEAHAKTAVSLRECIETCRECGIDDETMREWAAESGWALPTIATVLSQTRVGSGNRLRAVGAGRKVSIEKRSLVQCIVEYALRSAESPVEACSAVRSALRQLEKQTKGETNATEA